MIDEKIEEAAEKYIKETCTEDMSPVTKVTAEMSFHKGIGWFLKNLWHKPDEEPEQEKVALIQLKEDGSWHTANFIGIEFHINDMNKDDEYLVFTDDVTRWLYLDDLLKGENNG